MGVDLEKQIRTFMRPKLEHILFFYDGGGIYFHLTFVWKGVSINCAWKGVLLASPNHFDIECPSDCYYDHKGMSILVAIFK